MLIRCDAIPEPTFLWWDARLQPRLGTIEMRIMDAQTRVRDTAALAALVQCLVRREALGRADDREPLAPEVLEENRFLAVARRHGRGVRRPRRRPLRARGATQLAETLRSCAPHAEWLHCRRELASVGALAERPGVLRQRAVAARAEGLRGVLRAMHGDFVSTGPRGRAWSSVCARSNAFVADVYGPRRAVAEGVVPERRDRDL